MFGNPRKLQILFIFRARALEVFRKPWLMCVNENAINNLFRTGNKTMNAKKRKTNDKLREILRNLDPATHQEIREAYYKAIEGLETLAQSLEIADARQTESAGPLLDEHFIALEAVDAINNSQLGRYL